MARVVLLGASLGLGGLTACVVPIPASGAGEDAGVGNSAPVITGSTPPMPMDDGPIAITTTETFTVTVKDNDIGDTIYVRVFRDYDEVPFAPLNDLFVPSDPLQGEPERPPIALQTNPWCNLATPGELLVFDVVVADRPFSADLSELPIYRHLPEGAEYSIRSWIGLCP